MNRLTAAVLFLAVAIAPAAKAGTIIKLGFGTDSLPDIEMVGTTLSTFDDGTGSTVGDQNTEVTFLGLLAGTTPIVGDRASFTLDDVGLFGTATVVGSTVLQETDGGGFSLYDASNVLLLSGTLGNGTLSGPLGSIATGGFLTSEFGHFTDGSLLSILSDADMTLSSLSIALNDVNDGQGFKVNDETNQLLDFTADATANVGARTPEPAGLTIALLAGLALAPWMRGRRE